MKTFLKNLAIRRLVVKSKSKCYLAGALVFLACFSLLGGCMKKPGTKTDENLKKAELNSLSLNFVAGDVHGLTSHALSRDMRGIGLGKWLFEGLTRLNLKGQYELAGAQEMEISPCRTRYTFKLRPNFYCNGDRVLAADYERSWKQALKPDSTCSKAHLFYSIKNAEKAKKGEASLDEVGVKALSDEVLFVELEHPTSCFLNLLSLCLFAPFKMDDHEVLFNGPYKMIKRVKDNYSVLSKNEFFWDYANIAIDEVKISMIKDGMTALSLYKNGELDWIGDPFCYLSSDVVAAEVAKGNFSKGKEVMFPFWLYLNTKDPALSSPLIRRALSQVINRSEVAKHIYIGDTPLFTPVPHEACVSLPFSKKEASIEACKLFKEGIKELKLTKETFPPLKISFYPLGSHKEFVTYLKEAWEEAFGIQVHLEGKDWAAFYGDIASGSYQIGGTYIGADYNDRLACLELLSMENNPVNWQNSEYKKVIEKLKREHNTEKREKLFNQAEAILREDMPIIWVVNLSQHSSYPSNLKGLCFDQRGLPDLRWAYFE